MKITKCLNCGKPLTVTTRSFCNPCAETQADELQKVREYLYQNPRSSFLDLHRMTGVSLKTINDLILDRRLQYQ